MTTSEFVPMNLNNKLKASNTAKNGRQTLLNAIAKPDAVKTTAYL